ncbi:hypothetical protein GGR55DRAFT_675069 [Xylaria sp. FL0064]|nr:hypothetical protein GGR55DRAFT_675069 [Xylaria sp. FL0064]
MAQRFRLIAPRAKLAESLSQDLKATLFGGAGILVYRLGVPVPRGLLHFSSKKSPVNATNPVCEDKRVAKRLSSLPTELRFIIFSFLKDPVDLVSFGITSQYFLPIACEFIEKYYMSFWGNWAGKNVVCVGHEVKPGDYPPGLFSSEELEALRHKTTDISQDLFDPSIGRVIVPKAPNVPFTLHHFIYPNISKIEAPGAQDNAGLSYFLQRRCRDRGIDKDKAFHHISPQLNLDKDTYFPTDQKWILRNLTTKEIVYPDAIAVSPKRIRGPHMDVLGFGQVVMSRIFWSTSGSVSLSGAKDICRGKWAGHCFDITTLSRHEAETSEEEWRDISDEVAREVGSIYDSEYGPDWRERLKRGWESAQ